MNDDDLPEVPTPYIGDYAHAAAKIGLKGSGQAISKAAGSDLDIPRGDLFENARSRAAAEA